MVTAKYAKYANRNSEQDSPPVLALLPRKGAEAAKREEREKELADSVV